MAPFGATTAIDDFSRKELSSESFRATIRAGASHSKAFIHEIELAEAGQKLTSAPATHAANIKPDNVPQSFPQMAFCSFDCMIFRPNIEDDDQETERERETLLH